MTKSPKEDSHDLAMNLWARLAILEQCSLAIVSRSLLPSTKPKRVAPATSTPLKEGGGSHESANSSALD